MAVTTKIRNLVYERDNFQCVHCGTMSGLSLQHRAGKGMGGSKLMDGPENLATMCLRSNQKLESDAEFAQHGRIMGWKLSRHQDPSRVPIYYAPDGAFFLLDSEGTRLAEES